MLYYSDVHVWFCTYGLFLSAPVWLMEEFSHRTRGARSHFPSVSLPGCSGICHETRQLLLFQRMCLWEGKEKEERKRTGMFSHFFAIDRGDRRKIQGIHSFECAHLFISFLSSGLLQLKLHKGSEVSKISETTVPLNLPCRTSKMVRCHITRASWKIMMSQIMLHEYKITFFFFYLLN